MRALRKQYRIGIEFTVVVLCGVFSFLLLAFAVLVAVGKGLCTTIINAVSCSGVDPHSACSSRLPTTSGVVPLGSFCIKPVKPPGNPPAFRRPTSFRTRPLRFVVAQQPADPVRSATTASPSR